MPDRVVVGDTPRIKNTFEVDGVATDPTTIALAVTDPSGNTASYTYAGGTVTKGSTGYYYKDLTVDEAGKWSYTWTGTGTAADIVTRTFNVHAAAVDALDVLTYDEATTVLKVGPTDISQAARLQQAITAVSRRLDDEFGPIVKRAVPVATYQPAAWDLWVDPSPIYSDPDLTITEYDRNGADQLLTLETFDTKPDHGYRLEPRSGLGGGYTGRIKRTEGTTESTWGTVRISYTAGRYADTGTVDPVFKEAAAVTLINWWQQVLAQPAPQVGELDFPAYRFPRWALPSAVSGRDGIVPGGERPGRSVLA